MTLRTAPIPDWLRHARQAVLAAAVVCAFLVYGSMWCLAETVSVIDWRAAIGVLFTIGIVGAPVALFDFGSQLWIHTYHWRVARARWAAARCPACGHPMPPHRFDGRCAECGQELLQPPRPPRPRARFVGRFLAAVLLGSALAHAWIGFDVGAFRREAAANPLVHHSRPRAWPFRSSGLVYQPGAGISAHD